jgi:GntR family transcriptional regulator
MDSRFRGNDGGEDGASALLGSEQFPEVTMLDERSPVPLYYQLQEIIRSRIEGGEWPQGQQVPPEAELCKEFNVSRGTVRQALADLVREGLLHRRRGKGSFVARPKITQDLLSSAGFSAHTQEILGSELGTRLISVQTIPAGRRLADKLRVPEGSDVVQIRKVKLAEDQPFFLVTSYVPASVCPGLESEDHSRGSLIDLVQDRCGVQAATLRGWFEPVLIDEYEAAVLEVERGSPAMLLERIRYAADGRPLMTSSHIIRGDMCRLTFQITDSRPSAVSDQLSAQMGIGSLD